MTSADQGMGSIISEAERRGKEAVELETKNKIRRAKGLKPLLDEQGRKDAELAKKRRELYSAAATVDGDDVVKLFEMRRAQMLEGGADDAEKEVEEQEIRPQTRRDARTARAVREAEAVRRVEDLKNGRINHAGTWGKGGSLEGGDKTALPHNAPPENAGGDAQEPEGVKRRRAKSVAELSDVLFDMLDDLYGRLRVSFEGLETSLSDLQGRVAEIVTASTPKAPEVMEKESPADEFEALMSRKVPVRFEVAGTMMSFDAVGVFHTSPCITVVSKMGSAKIAPKPGARLLLSYEMDGTAYENDPVTYLGTRFDLPMFGLSFVGFIRDLEAGDDADADTAETAEG